METTDYHYDSNNRLLSEQNSSSDYTTRTDYGYDPAGNLLSKYETAKQGENSLYTAETVLEYNSKNQLHRVTSPDDSITEYGYYPHGLRSYKEHDNIPTRYIYDRGNIVAELDNDLNLTAKNVFTQGIAFRQAEQGTYSYIKAAHGDVLLSTLKI